MGVHQVTLKLNKVEQRLVEICAPWEQPLQTLEDADSGDGEYSLKSFLSLKFTFDFVRALNLNFSYDRTRQVNIPLAEPSPHRASLRTK